ncbi:MAG TPA: response regulator transcription factor [Bacteroidota bacterium]|nr:response regulator transcription factor [Bacteroidota bacterium]
MIFLIVDDNPKIRATVKQFLASRIPGHHIVYEASDGREAIGIFEERRPDWVFMDIKMEPVDGLTGTRNIIAAHPDAKIVILTNYDDPQFRRAAREAGATAFVAKGRLERILQVLAEVAAFHWNGASQTS